MTKTHVVNKPSGARLYYYLPEPGEPKHSPQMRIDLGDKECWCHRPFSEHSDAEFDACLDAAIENWKKSKQ